MKKTAILIDSSYGIKEGQYPDVYVVPMEIIVTENGRPTSYLDNVEIFNKEICEKISQGIDVKTSQPIIGNVLEILDKITTEYEMVYALPITSTISGTYNNWVSLAKEYKNVHVYDQTMVGRLAEWTIIDFVEKNKKGDLNDKTITEYLNFTRKHRAAVLIVPDASQLKKGGRVSNFKSLLIKIFGLKLIITLDQHGLLFKDKAGKLEETVKKAKIVLGKVIPLETKKIKRLVIFRNTITDVKFNVEEYINLFKGMYPNIKIEYVVLPSVITAHVGPNYIVFGADLE